MSHLYSAKPIILGRCKDKVDNTTISAILNNIEEGVVVTDVNGVLIYWNKQAEVIMNSEFDDNLGCDKWQMKYGVYKSNMTTPLPCEQMPLYKAMKGIGTTKRMVYIKNNEMPGGAWIRVIASSIYDESGTLVGGITCFRDVTTDQQARSELVQSLRDISSKMLAIESNLESCKNQEEVDRCPLPTTAK